MQTDTSQPAEPPESSVADSGAADSGARTETRCGDGQMTGSEKCDISIPPGQPGACPTECPAINACTKRALNGTACYAECVLLELVCEAGDGCCPAKCTVDNDPDCSPSCGDGLIERSETCDPESETQCKQRDSDCDDRDPCTIDTLTGSARNCNSACVHMPVTATQSGDDCCPSGANATTDSDCKPRCGNGVREADEVCDGGEGCDANCKTTGSPTQIACLSTASGPCETCACINCTATEQTCRNGSDAIENAKCGDVLDCTQQNNCIGQACYCDPDAFCLVAGPCLKQIQAAAGTDDPYRLATALVDPTTTVGKSYAADSCRITQCRDSCR